GAGATFILPEKLGVDLAREGLLTAQSYTGAELGARSVGLRVLPRAEVEKEALSLARQMAQSAGRRLMHLKRAWTSAMRPQLEETYRLELAMHEQTFVGQSVTREAIEERFQEPSTVSPVIAEASPSDDGDVLSAITSSLRALLAGELQMRESDIDDHGQ